MMYTTLNKIRAHHPCTDGWKTLLSHLGKTEADDEPLSFLTILESNGLGDAIWCLRSVPEYTSQSRLYAIWCARRVKHLMTDPRSIAALDAAWAAAGADRAAAWAAAWAAWAAWAAGDATWDAAWDAEDSAWDAERAAQEEEFCRMIEAPSLYPRG